MILKWRTASEVVLSEAESTTLSAVTQHVVACQTTDFITCDLLTLGKAVRVVTAYNMPRQTYTTYTIHVNYISIARAALSL